MAERKYSAVAVPSTLKFSVTDSATQMTVFASTGWPTSFPFTVVLDEDTEFEEAVNVTGTVGAQVYTIARGFDGTPAQAHSAGAVARHSWSAIDLREAQQHKEATAGVHGVAGSFVDTSSAQTLQNKNLQSPTIGDFTNAEHDHSDAANGGTVSVTDLDDLPAGDVVGTTAAQVLTNKTVTAPTLTLKQSAGPTPTAEGDIQWDTDDNKIKVGDGSGTKTFSDDSETAVHGVATVAGLSESQVFTNKTIDGDSNTLTDIAASSIKKEAWTAYTPIINSGWSGGTPTIEGKYQRIGNTVHLRGSITCSTGMTFTTSPTISLPLSGASGGVTNLNVLFSNGSNNWRGTGHLNPSGSAFLAYGLGTDGIYLNVTGSVPFTWANGHKLQWSGTYETGAA